MPTRRSGPGRAGLADPQAPPDAPAAAGGRPAAGPRLTGQALGRGPLVELGDVLDDHLLGRHQVHLVLLEVRALEDEDRAKTPPRTWGRRPTPTPGGSSFPAGSPHHHKQAGPGHGGEARNVTGRPAACRMTPGR